MGHTYDTIVPVLLKESFRISVDLLRQLKIKPQPNITILLHFKSYITVIAASSQSNTSIFVSCNIYATRQHSSEMFSWIKCFKNGRYTIHIYIYIYIYYHWCAINMSNIELVSGVTTIPLHPYILICQYMHVVRVLGCFVEVSYWLVWSISFKVTLHRGKLTITLPQQSQA